MAKREPIDGARIAEEWLTDHNWHGEVRVSPNSPCGKQLARYIDAALRAAEERMRERAAREIAACQHDWDYENEIARNVQAVLVNLEAAIRRLEPGGE